MVDGGRLTKAIESLSHTIDLRQLNWQNILLKVSQGFRVLFTE